MRLDKYICKSTDYSITDSHRLLQMKRIRVDGEIVILPDFQVHQQRITLDEQTLVRRPFRYIMLHKPANTVCSHVNDNYPSVLNLLDIPYKKDLHFVGRLDADTTGLVLLTDDGSWTFNIIKPEANCPKVYRVKLQRDITTEAIKQLQNGIHLQGMEKLTLPAKVASISSKEILLTITEGKFHQVKRMFKALRNRVISLHRESVGSIKLDVNVSEWRYLEDEEINSFRVKKFGVNQN